MTTARKPGAPRATAAQCMQHLAAYAHMVAAEAVVREGTSRGRHAFINRALNARAASLPSVDMRGAGLAFLRARAHEALEATLAAGKRPPALAPRSDGRRRTS